MFDVASDENVTRKQRLHDAHHATLRHPFQAQSGMKNLQPQVATQIGRHQMLVFWFCACAMPRFRCNIHDRLGFTQTPVAIGFYKLLTIRLLCGTTTTALKPF
jgi:hypothetical protein